MKQLPSNQLDPRIKNVWRITDAAWLTALALSAGITCFFLSSVPGVGNVATLVGSAVGLVWVVGLILCVFVLPPIRYARWRYEVSDDFLDIAKGIVWRTRVVIPFIRVQNTDTRQGPILRMLGLASVTVSTAAREHVIPGLDADVAELLRDRAAELARIAREDV